MGLEGDGSNGKKVTVDGHPECLQKLHDLGAGASLIPKGKKVTVDVASRSRCRPQVVILVLLLP